MRIFTIRVWPEPLLLWRKHEHKKIIQFFKYPLNLCITEVSSYPKFACGSTLFTMPLHPGIFETCYIGSLFNPSAPSRRYSKTSVIREMEIFTFPQKFTHWHNCLVYYFCGVLSFCDTLSSLKLKGTLAADLVIYRVIYTCKKAGQHFFKHLRDWINQFPKEEELAA